MASPDPRRIDVRMDNEMAQLVNELTEQTGLPRAEVLRRAVNVYAKVREEVRQKGRVILQNKEGEMRELVNL